jgi:TRAP-type C4-dicarboxylate transport system substrate-binding protein
MTNYKQKIVAIAVLALAVCTITTFFVGCAKSSNGQTNSTTTGGGTQAVQFQDVIYWKGQYNFATTGAAYGPFPQGTNGYPSKQFVEWLQKATNGRLVIEMAEPGSLFPANQSLQALENGLVDMAFSNGQNVAGVIPEAIIENGLPFAWEDTAEVWDCFYNYGLYDVMKDIYAKHDIVYLMVEADTYTIGLGANYPVNDLAALKGKKIRAFGTQADYITLLGASPTNMAIGDIYQALQLKTIDGWVAAPALMEFNKLKEVTSYFVTDPSFGQLSGSLLINKKSFDALPADIQEIILRDSRYVSFTLTSQWRQQNKWVIEHASKENNVTIVNWPKTVKDKLQKEAIETVWPRYFSINENAKKIGEILMKQARDYLKY